MSAPDAVLDQVCELLERLPGVVVLSHRFIDADAQIEIRIDEATIFEDLQHDIMSANVGMDHWLRPSAMATAVFPLHRVMTASASPMEGPDFGYLQILGIHLIWRLHRLGLLTAAEANPRLRAWNALCVCDWPAGADPR